ncbi:MAG: M56 family metallopeptidase [Gemmatimonadaceae bacterium]
MTMLPGVTLTAPWIAYGLIVGALLAAVAALGESVLRAAGRPARWSWALALGLTVALVALAPGRTTYGSGVTIDLAQATTVAGGASAPVPRWGSGSLAAVAAIAGRVAEPARWLLAAAGRVVPAAVDRWLGVAWVGLSLLFFALFAIVYGRFVRARARWPIAMVQGTEVRVAPDAGPAVVGLSRPEIVVPEWLLDRTTDEQRLVLAHESEHVAARDPLLLAAACIAVAIIPWHPAAWWMLSRLRLAVELDCDGRVLRRGVAPRSYGTLLIDLAGRCSGLRIGAPALADESSHLQQRLIAMTTRTSPFSITRASVAAAIAGVALVAACEAKLPTQTEVNDMTAASAATSAQKMALMSEDTAGSQYKVNGVVVSAAEANAILPERIASIEVLKGTAAPNGKAVISIKTRQAGDTTHSFMMTKRVMSGSGNGEAMVGDPAELPRRRLENFAGVILVDGVRVTEAAMQALAPGDIVSVEVIKGPTAKTLYDAPEAANGVIRVTTKKGAAAAKSQP